MGNQLQEWGRKWNFVEGLHTQSGVQVVFGLGHQVSKKLTMGCLEV